VTRTTLRAWRDPVARFTILAGLGLILVGSETVRASHEVGDFWEHAATVRELMRHTAHPGNALLAVHAPSAFFSPYALLVALAAKVTGAGAVHALAAAGLVNYCLLVIGLWCFARVFSSRPQAPFYALLFVWLLWGVHPWEYSGFFDLRELGYGIAYPSTFATGVGFLTAALWRHSLRSGGRTRWLGVAGCGLGVAVVVLTHPVAGVATVAAMVAISLTEGERRNVALLAGVLAAAALLCLAWPYYPALRLLSDQGVYDPSNAPVYQGWLEQAFPALAALVLFVYDSGSLHRRRLAIYCAPLLAFFIYGDISGHWSDGRELAYLIVGAQIGLADLAAAVEQRTALRPSRRRAVVLAAGLTLFAGFELANMADGLKGSLPGTGSAEPAAYGDYRAAVAGIPPDSVVAAPLQSGMEAAIAVYGGKLVGTARPLAFVSDQAERRRVLTAFYSAQATESYRRHVIREYHVRYVLVADQPADPAAAGALVRLGTTVRRTAGFVLVAV
jgi:hypothetical protein